MLPSSCRLNKTISINQSNDKVRKDDAFQHRRRDENKITVINSNSSALFDKQHKEIFLNLSTENYNLTLFLALAHAY